MSEEFVALAVYLKRSPAAPKALSTTPMEAASIDALAGQPSPMSVPPADVSRDIVGQQKPGAHSVYASVSGELAFMRLAVAESFERAARRVLAELADEVLARELVLAPSDIEALLRRATAALMELEPVRMTVAAADAPPISSPDGGDAPTSALPVRVDAALESGDFIVEVRDGSFESYRAFRVQTVLDRAMARLSADVAGAATTTQAVIPPAR